MIIEHSPQASGDKEGAEDFDRNLAAAFGHQ
jgi:hypothetical protein